MARIRTIKPELPADEKLSTVSRDARLTFLLLITQADDEGLILAARRQLLGILYPLDESVTAELLASWINELVSIGRLIWRRTHDGAYVLELVNWAKHQRIDKPTPSKIRPLIAKPSREPRELVASGQRIEVEVGSGEGSGVVDLSPRERGNPHPHVDNPAQPATAPLVARATRNGNSGTAPLPFQAEKLLRSCYASASPRKAGDARAQLLATLSSGAVFDRTSRVQAVDRDHLDDACRRVLAKPPRKPELAARFVLTKLRDTYGETRAARERAAHAEPPRRRIAESRPTPIGDLVRRPA